MYSYTEETASGATNVFPVPFPYLRRGNVLALVDGVSQPFSWLSDGTIAIAGSPEDLTGKTVRIQRRTPGQDALVTWKSGGLDPGDLTLSDTQLLYLFQEAYDAALRALNLGPGELGFDFRGFRGINAADPLTGQDVVTKAHMERRVLDIIALVVTSGHTGGLDGYLREALRTLPTTEPGQAGLPWNNGGVLCVTGGEVATANLTVLEAFLQTLPVEEPGVPGQPWLNGGVVMLSPGTSPVAPDSVTSFTAYMLSRPFMPVEAADVPAGGAWYRYGTVTSWVPNFVAGA